MVQGGASGSPVFLNETGRVIGILYAGLTDTGVAFRNPSADGKAAAEPIFYTVPTNISYVVPSHYIRTALELLPKRLSEFMTPPSDTKTIDEMLQNVQLHNALEGRHWTRMERETS